MAKTRFIWDPENDVVLQEKDENGVTQVDYNVEPVPYGRLISQKRATGEKRYHHYDGQGNTLALADENGDVTDRYEYTGFGEEIKKEGETPNRYRYGGQHGYQTDDDTGRIYVRERMYQPRVARWMSQDALRSSDHPILYIYAKNSPIVFADPSGNVAFLQGGNPSMVPRPPRRIQRCNVRICLTDIPGPARVIGGHLSLVLERTIKGKRVEWGYRGGPGFKIHKRGDCDCTDRKYGQLVTSNKPYRKGWIDFRPPKEEKCKSIVVQAADCDDVHACFLETMRRIDNCCIPYRPIRNCPFCAQR